MQNRDVLISGASIAGPALAYWLHQRGFRPTIVERAPAPRPGGQTVDLRGAGRTVVERMHLMDTVRALCVDQAGLAFVDATGRVRAKLPADLFGGEGIVSEIEILRGDLCQVLVDATSVSTEYLFDDTITALEQVDDGVTVSFESAPTRQFGLVIGADGPHSVTRQLAFGPEADFVRPIDCYTSWFTTPAELDLDGWCLMHNAPGGLVVTLRPGRHLDEVKAALSFRSSPIAYDRGDLSRQQNILRERFTGVGWEADRLIAAMPAAPDFFFDSLGQVRMPHWTRGRVALVGDAGYCATPLTGLGTSLALVGAYVLAGELGAADDHRAAFDRYEQIMRPYVERSQKLPPGGVSGYAPRSAAYIKARTASMGAMTRWPLRSLMARQFAKAGDIALPAYEQAPVG
jgi:2-polyprenyl-6-methoxyphenol hydroxylase-like FAD-dependent oxidoreductase